MAARASIDAWTESVSLSASRGLVTLRLTSGHRVENDELSTVRWGDDTIRSGAIEGSGALRLVRTVGSSPLRSKHNLSRLRFKRN